MSFPTGSEGLPEGPRDLTPGGALCVSVTGGTIAARRDRRVTMAKLEDEVRRIMVGMVNDPRSASLLAGR